MINTFTKISMIGFLVVCVTTIFAQIPANSPFPVSFSVIDANGVETNFPYSTMADFGENLSETVSGPLEWARDGGVYDDNGDGIPEADYADSLGCNPETLMPNISGKVALIRRGICDFSKKIFNAQEIGAIGAIICNTNATDPDELISMGLGDANENVVIPAIFVSFNTCQFLATIIDSGAALDVKFSVSPFNNNFGPSAYGTPVDQIRPMTDIQVSLLNGLADAPLLNTTVSVDITDPNGVVTSMSEVVPSIAPFENALIEFDDYLPAAIGQYNMVFSSSVSSETLQNRFIITDATWQMDNGAVNDWIAPTEEQFLLGGVRYDLGNIYRTGSVGGIATAGTFMLENAIDLFTGDPDSDLFEVVLYDLDQDGDGVGPTGSETDYDSFDEVGYAQYVLNGNEGVYEAIVVPFDDPVVLKPNGQYALVVKYLGLIAAIGIPPHYAYAGNEDYPDLGSFFFTDELALEGFAGGWHGVVRLHTDNFVVGTADIEPLAANKVNVFPSPANETINLSLNLDANAAEVKIGILDMMGKVVYSNTLNNIQNEVTPINVSNLLSGTYFISVVTPEGFRSVKFTVVQ